MTPTSTFHLNVRILHVSPSSKVRDLGVVFDQYLTFHDHISGICKSTHFPLRGIGRIRNILTFDATAQLIHALITSRLDFCNSILNNLPNKQIERLQWIQNQATCILKRVPRRYHITPVLRELHWLRIHDIIIFKILLLTHKALNDTSPEYVCDLIRINVKSTTIRTRASLDPCFYVFPQLVKRVLIHSLIDLLCMLLQHYGMPFIKILEYCPLKCQDTSLSEVLCKLILIVFILFV